MDFRHIHIYLYGRHGRYRHLEKDHVMTTYGRTSIYYDNPGAAAAPGVSNDSTQNYTVGSVWVDTRFKIRWICIDATAGAALWVPQVTGMLGSLIGANMNVTTDQPFIMRAATTSIKYSVTRILATNPSTSLTTVVGGVYDTASKGGNAIVAATQVYSALTAAAKLLSLTLAAAGTANVFSVAPILSLTTIQGGAATADFYLFGDILPAA
jgi:hypothetical protein